jgi:hypothetical protein
VRVRTLSLAVLAAACPGAASAQFASVPVVRTTLEAAGNVGRYNDVVTRPDGTALVLYTGDGEATLRAASCQDPACTAATSVPVDVDGPFAHVAAAIGAGGAPVVVYQHAPTASVRMALCADAVCSSAVVRTVEDLGALRPGVAVAVGADGLPVAVYGDAAATGVTVAHCDDAACTTFTRTDHPANQPGEEPAAVAGSDGLVVFAARDGLDVTVSHCAAAACTSASTVRLVGTSTPQFQNIYRRPSLALGANGLVEIATETSAVQGPFAAVLVSHRRCADVGCTSIALDGAIFALGGTPALAALSDGLPVASFRTSPSDGLSLVRCRNVDCTQRDVIQLETSATGPQSSLTVTAGDVILASFYDSTDGDLEVAAVAPYPSVAISGPVSVVEGNSGTTPATFQVTRTGATGAVFTVDVATNGGTATAGTDYLPVSGTLTFAPGELVRTVEVAVVGDVAIEPDEFFGVQLTNPQGAVLEGGGSSTTILNDDSVPPALAISDTAVVEGDAGGTEALFTVTLAPASAASVQVGFATADQGALAGTDYTAASGTLTFAPGETVRVVAVPVLGDAADEPHETYLVQLGSAQGAVVADGVGVGTILDDDDPVQAELRHGAWYSGDLAAGPDAFGLLQEPYASYEVVLDASAESGLALERREASGALLQSAVAVGTGSARSLRWRPAGTTTVSDQVVRVSGPCGATCAAGDVYRVRVYDTTLRAARFNNSATQTTVLLLQNASDAPAVLAVHFWAPDGSLIATHAPAGPLPPHGVLVLDTSAVAPAASGSLTLAHDAPYGGLAGKAVAIEPSTGFAFDTPLDTRPR